MISQWRWQHLSTTSFPGKIEHAGKNDHSIEATTKSNDPLQTVAKTLANLVVPTKALMPTMLAQEHKDKTITHTLHEVLTWFGQPCLRPRMRENNSTIE